MAVIPHRLSVQLLGAEADLDHKHMLITSHLRRAITTIALAEPYEIGKASSHMRAGDSLELPMQLFAILTSSRACAGVTADNLFEIAHVLKTPAELHERLTTQPHWRSH